MAHVATITIDHTKVAGDLTDYVVAVIPNSDAGWADLYALCLEGGGDIRTYKDDDTTELAREIVSFSVIAETGEIHIKYSGTLSSSVDTDIHIYADGSSSDYAVGDTYGRNAVWSAYEWVFHGALSSGALVDSAGNVTTTKQTGNTPTNPAGILGNGFNPNSAYWTTNYVPFTAIGTGDFSFQTWSNFNTNASARRSVVYMGKNLAFEDVFYVQAYRSTGDSPVNEQVGTYRDGASGQIDVRPTVTVDGTQKLYHYTRTGTNGKTYNNGTLADNITNAEIAAGLGVSGNSVLTIAAAYTSGVQPSLSVVLDEMRFIGSVLSANQIDTEHENQNSPATFYSVAAAPSGTAYTQQIEEIVSVADTMRRDVTRTITESATTTASVIKATAKQFTDNATIADTVTSLGVKLKEILENVTITETFTRAITKSYSEAVDVADNIVKDVTKAFNEVVETTVTATALAATYVQVLLETVLVSDTMSKLVGYVRSFTETVTTTVHFRLNLNGINAFWSDLYNDTADAWEDLYTDTTDAWSDKYIDN